MLEFLTGVFIILLSIFFLFISSNKQIENKNLQKTEKTTFLGNNENVSKNDFKTADITDGEEVSGKVVETDDNMYSSLEKNNSTEKETLKNEENNNTNEKDNNTNEENNNTSKEKETLEKNNISEEEKNQKIIEEKIKIRKEIMQDKLGKVEEKYLNIEKISDKEFVIIIQKEIKIKKDLEEKQKKEQAKLAEEKKQKELEKNNSKEKIDFNKYVSLSQKNKNSFIVYIYKNGKIEEKWITKNISPIKQTINLVLKDSPVKLNSLVLKNKTLTIKLSDKNKLNDTLKEELINTAKFFKQVDNVVIK